MYDVRITLIIVDSCIYPSEYITSKILAQIELEFVYISYSSSSLMLLVLVQGVTIGFCTVLYGG